MCGAGFCDYNERLYARSLPSRPKKLYMSDADEKKLEDENTELQERLKALQNQLKEEEQFSYIVTRGFITGAENVFSETMEVAEGKQWCNSHDECKGFYFLGGDGIDQPDDEVTVTFKGAPEAGDKLHVEPDQAYVSYVKASSTSSVLGAFGDAGMQLEGGQQSLISHSLTTQSIALVFVLALALVFGCRRRCRQRPAVERPLLPIVAGEAASGAQPSSAVRGS